MTVRLRRQNDMYCSGQNLNECIGADETLTKPRPLWEVDPHLATRRAFLSQVRPSVGPGMTEKRPESDGIVACRRAI